MLRPSAVVGAGAPCLTGASGISQGMPRNEFERIPEKNAMPDETLSEKLARHNVALRFDQIPAEVTDAAKLHILDSIGCLLAGTLLEPGKLAYDMAIATSSATSSRASTLFGTAERVSYLDAVQAMSVAAHCGEMDDIHGGAATCIGGMIIPALLAMAEKSGGSGRKFIEAAIVGYEMVIRVGLCIDAPKLFRTRLVAQHDMRRVRRRRIRCEVFGLAGRTDG